MAGLLDLYRQAADRRGWRLLMRHMALLVVAMGLILFPEGKDDLGELCARQWRTPVDDFGAVVKHALVVAERDLLCERRVEVGELLRSGVAGGDGRQEGSATAICENGGEGAD
jgi:hypothetical protein